MKNRITCYSAGQQLPGIHFFILSKELNAGKPLDAACPNCFVFSCKSEEERDKYFRICYGLLHRRRVSAASIAGRQGDTGNSNTYFTFLFYNFPHVCKNTSRSSQ
ncbi:MAG: hypothetical protein IPG39_03495 [Bacteroidetes bacterium]|nr:hypothetical protein [Bacteroidota bacterium]